MFKTFVRTVLFAMLVVVTPLRAEDIAVPPPAPMDTCPVCGMLVAKYTEWVATVLYKDGHAHHFDGAKDMFKFLKDMGKYGDGHTEADIAVIAVTEYYDLMKIDARQAFYVVGSDTYGPMGHELVPLATEADAKEFLADHKGQFIVTFDQVTPEMLDNLDQGVFEQP